MQDDALLVLEDDVKSVCVCMKKILFFSEYLFFWEAVNKNAQQVVKGSLLVRITAENKNDGEINSCGTKCLTAFRK